MEKNNFAHAGKVLAEVWSQTIIDNHPVVAEYIEDIEEIPVSAKSEEWRATHVRESHYFLQIVKCPDRTCCSNPRSSFLRLIKDMFLPGPWPLVQTAEDGLRVKLDGSGKYPSVFVRLALSKDILPRSADNYPKGLPYDFACPSVQDKISKRICKECGLYLATIKSVTSNAKTCGQKKKKGEKSKQGSSSKTTSLPSTYCC